MANKKMHPLEKRLCAAALAYPGAFEAFPWGDHVVKVRPTEKIFVFMGSHEGRFGCSLKLPESNALALEIPGATPTGYGLGKAGWVSLRETGGGPPIALLLEFLDESYRAVAPAKRVKELDAASGAIAVAPEKPKKKPAKKRR